MVITIMVMDGYDNYGDDFDGDDGQRWRWDGKWQMSYN